MMKSEQLTEALHLINKKSYEDAVPEIIATRVNIDFQEMISAPGNQPVRKSSSIKNCGEDESGVNSAIAMIPIINLIF